MSFWEKRNNYAKQKMMRGEMGKKVGEERLGEK
jgi:hypothetical protein